MCKPRKNEQFTEKLHMKHAQKCESYVCNAISEVPGLENVATSISMGYNKRTLLCHLHSHHQWTDM